MENIMIQRLQVNDGLQKKKKSTKKKEKINYKRETIVCFIIIIIISNIINRVIYVPLFFSV